MKIVVGSDQKPNLDHKKEVKRCCFLTWKIIKLGTGLKTANDFRYALKRDGYRIDDWANDILGKSAFAAANQKTKMELVTASGDRIPRIINII